VRFSFRRRLQHPFYPGLKLAPVAAVHAAPALYGDTEDLLDAARCGARVDRAVFALRRADSPFLSEPERDVLWETYQAPVYSLLLGRDGDPIAFECEAQDGLHLRDDYSGGLLFGRVESRLCECGRPGRRLMPPAQAVHEIPAEDVLMAG
jgi:hypothetical protein